MKAVKPKRLLKEAGKRSLHKLFVLGQRCGLDIMPRHFYSGIPDVRQLSKTDYWRAASKLPGVLGTDLDEQLAFVRDICAPCGSQLASNDLWQRGVNEAKEIGFGPIEGEFLSCFIRVKQPRRIIQIGCGASTAMILLAAADVNYTPDLTCIEPFPSPFLRRMHQDGKIHLIDQPAQLVELGRFQPLQSGDLFFVDSTHTVKTGSEVNRIILEILPRLVPGVHVHFHDINFPYGYRRDVLRSNFFSQETVLLHAFLIGNAHCTIRASLSMLHYGRPKELAEVLPHYRPQPNSDGLRTDSRTEGYFPSSTYLQIQ